jgi:hypothetical protein
MVPRTFAVLDSLPLNANGKVDRKALPEPVFASGLAYEAPQGHVAQTLAGVWSEVLKIEQVGQQDNFFDLGGHSLLLIRAHRLLEDRLQLAIPLVNLFKYPTIESLARWIEQAPPGAASSSAFSAAASDDRALRQRAAMLQRRKATERVN